MQFKNLNVRGNFGKLNHSNLGTLISSLFLIHAFVLEMLNIPIFNSIQYLKQLNSHISNTLNILAPSSRLQYENFKYMNFFKYMKRAVEMSLIFRIRWCLLSWAFLSRTESSQVFII